MSIASLTDARIHRTSHSDRRTQTVSARGKREHSHTARRTITPLPAANQVARYIPTEAIGIYIAILALFNPLVPKPGQQLWQLDFHSRWWFFGISLIGTGALVWLMYLGKARAAGHKLDGPDIPVFEMLIAIAAMAAWALALPDNPLQSFSWWKEGISPVILSAATFLIPLVAAALGKSPPTYEEAAAS